MTNLEKIQENNSAIQDCLNLAQWLPEGGGGSGATFTLLNASDYDVCINGSEVYAYEEGAIPVAYGSAYIGFVRGDLSNAQIRILNYGENGYEEAYILTQCYDESIGFTFFVYYRDHYPDETWILEVIE